MPHPCVVCGRSRMNPNNREEDYMFFGFPVNYDERCKKWLEFCCREDLYKLTKKQLLQRMVCSKHFERKDFLNEYQDRLNCTGVPSIYDPTQSLYNITCVLCRRFRKDPPPDDYDGTTFHHFPGEEFRCLKWLDFVGLDSYYRLTRKEILYCYICSNHFDKTQFVNGYKARLTDYAVPNIRFPDEKNSTESVKIERPLEAYHANDKSKKYEPFTSAVLESQACAACGRSRSDPRNKLERYKFHPFPAYEIGRCLRWCQFLGREDLLKMSPNQIRKLVLCSKHFLSGQSFHKIGPCDAVPTINSITDNCKISESQIAEIEPEDNNDEDHCAVNQLEFQDTRRSLVSSKKPKVDNRPTPLAKKRGRGKRSTSINIPKLNHLNIENHVTKMPIPSASWKIHMGNNQFQPLTIANTNATNAFTTDGKKLILPFTGNISNLGAPIPVNSLSSIPPGFLIKINLPDQEKKTPGKASRKRNRGKKDVDKVNDKINVGSEIKTVKRRTRKQKIEPKPEVPQEKIKVKKGKIRKSPEMVINREEIVDEEILPDVIEVLDDELMDLDDSYGEQMDEDEKIHVYQEITENVDRPKVSEISKVQKLRRPKMSGRARRSLLPIRTEVKHFLHKLKPHMKRLPRKARAQLKLSIVNLVIDRL